MNRDPRLAALSQEELHALDAITGKLALPAPKEPENQAESGPANIAEIAAEVLKEKDSPADK